MHRRKVTLPFLPFHTRNIDIPPPLKQKHETSSCLTYICSSLLTSVFPCCILDVFHKCIFYVYKIHNGVTLSCNLRRPIISLRKLLELLYSKRIFKNVDLRAFIFLEHWINMQGLTRIISLSYFNCYPLITYSERAVHLHRFHMQVWPAVMLCGWKGFHSLPRYEYGMLLQPALPDYTTVGLSRLFQCSVYIPRPCRSKVQAGCDCKFSVQYASRKWMGCILESNHVFLSISVCFKYTQIKTLWMFVFV